MAQALQQERSAAVRQFTERQRAILAAVARRALANRLVLQRPAQQAVADAVRLVEAVGEERAALLEPGACFVTLWQRESGELRGCRGDCSPHQELVAAVGYMALAAGLEDPRFAEVTAAELPRLRIEISVLTPLQAIDPDQVEIGRHGLMIVQGKRRGLLLPQVAVEHGLTREQFLDAVCWKAGLPGDAWRAANSRLWAFETESWSEA